MIKLNKTEEDAIDLIDFLVEEFELIDLPDEEIDIQDTGDDISD